MITEATRNRLVHRHEVERRYEIAKRFLEVAAVKREGPSMVKIGRLARYRAYNIAAWIERQVVHPDG